MSYKMKSYINKSIILAASLFSTAIYATPLDIATAPLYLGGSNEPNIMFTIDDSGSMHFEMMPESISPHWRKEPKLVYPRVNGVYAGTHPSDDVFNTVPIFSSTDLRGVTMRSNINTMYYDPKTQYLPWVASDGTSLGNVPPSAAPHNIMIPSIGTRDLTTINTQNARWWDSVSFAASPGDMFGGAVFSVKSFWPAVYYTFLGGSENDVSNFAKTEIKPATAPYIISGMSPSDRADCTEISATSVSCSYDQEIQNFANWYTYYRSRLLTSRAGVGRAFSQQGTSMRVGYGQLNKGFSDIDGVSTKTIMSGVRHFAGSNRAGFFDLLYKSKSPMMRTPLRQAAESVGEYFKRTDNKGPWGDNPGTNASVTPHISCRQSYHILMSDGYWNGDVPGVGDADNIAGPTITGPGGASYSYSPTPPYAGAGSNTLADVAMKYWKTDLRPGLVNDVPTNPEDPAFWQHLVHFTVGLGVTGTLDSTTDLPLITSGVLAWPNPIPNQDETRLDDLWHAAVNSRGTFFTASKPADFAAKLSDILTNIVSRGTSAASSVAFSSGSVSSSTALYQATFDSAEWSGKLVALGLSVDPTTKQLVIGPNIWADDAGQLIPAAAARSIFTHTGSLGLNHGRVFEFASLTAEQQTLLNNDSNILDYLRGDQSNEPAFRERFSVLGDLIHSSPTYVAGPVAQYPDVWGGSEDASLYSDFRELHKNRTPQVYVGANDGMLHAFDAATGVETFAYVPAGVYNNLAELADPNYTHKYYVDETPVVTDAFFNSAWHTVLVSGLRGGGQSIFALDVTHPTSFNQTNVLWEFTDDDLGYTFGEPSIVRMHNGRWAAIFSGGYDNTRDNDGDGVPGDSTNGNAYLYIVDLETGAQIAKLDTRKGILNDPTGNNRSNGLSEPSAVDVNADFIVDLIYAGDLFGNVWKVDVTDNTASNWDFIYTTGPNPKPVFTACATATLACTGADVQPITTQIQVARHPEEAGYFMFFGTGKYFEVGDNTQIGQTTQTFYGLWDKAENTLAPFDRSNLVARNILEEVTAASGYGARITSPDSDHPISWATDWGWYMDLIVDGAVSNFGERQVSNSRIRNKHIVFSTVIPTEDACEPALGGTWIMELDMFTGGRLEYSPFDMDNDGLFTDTDFVQDSAGNWVPASGRGLDDFLLDTPGFLDNPVDGVEYKVGNGSNNGELTTVTENPGVGASGRQSWRELDF